jgi:hypothetical protein
MPRVSNATLEGWIEEAADEVSREAARVEWEKRGTFTRCGARTRRGTPCQRWGVRGTGRCPNHGGLSSGPTTAAGKARIAAALHRRWRGWRRAHPKLREKRSRADVRLETLNRLLHMPRSGHPCGARTSDGPCSIEGFQPSGRCWLHGAAAPAGPKQGPKPPMTSRQRRGLQKRIARRLKELGASEISAHEQRALDRGAGYGGLLRRIDETADLFGLGGLGEFDPFDGLDHLF